MNIGNHTMTTPPVQQRFQALVDGHKRIIYKVCNGYCRNRDDRQDLAQEIMIQLWRSFASYDEQYRFSTWMYRISLNVAISFYRRENTRSWYVRSDEDLLLDAVDDSSHHTAEMQALYEFIDKLEPLSKALVLLYLDGNTYQEIAEVLGTSVTNVGTRISRLKQTMKQEFTAPVKREFSHD